MDTYIHMVDTMIETIETEDLDVKSSNNTYFTSGYNRPDYAEIWR